METKRTSSSPPPLRTTQIPGYWLNETGGELIPAVRAYLRHQTLTTHEIALLRAYLTQWINAPMFMGAEVDSLRQRIGLIETEKDLRDWAWSMIAAGCDPF